MPVKLTQDNAYNGLARFVRDMDPPKITWGDIHRLDPTEDGLKKANRIAAKLHEALSKAEAFARYHRPNRLEAYMLHCYVKSIDRQIADLDIRVEYLKGAIELQKTLEDRVSEYENLWEQETGDIIPF